MHVTYFEPRQWSSYSFYSAFSIKLYTLNKNYPFLLISFPNSVFRAMFIHQCNYFFPNVVVLLKENFIKTLYESFEMGHLIIDISSMPEWRKCCKTHASRMVWSLYFHNWKNWKYFLNFIFPFPQFRTS